MSDETAFLAAIRAEPECDTRRLVFADWLDEQGSLNQCRWASLIRTQIALQFLRDMASGGRALSTRQLSQGERLRSRQKALLRQVRLFGENRAHAPRYIPLVACWGNCSPRFPVACLVERGFVSQVWGSCRGFVAVCGPIFASHPVARVTLTDRRAVVMGGYYHWLVRDSKGEPCPLPLDIWGDAPGVPASRPPEEAFADLSARLVAYGFSRQEVSV